MEWVQAYEPLHHAWLSTVAAGLPIVLRLVTLGIFEWKAHWAALTGLVSALVVSIAIYGMPVPTALSAAVISRSSLVRLDIGPDGKVTKARENRCLDALAEPALAAARKVEFKLAPGAKPPEQIDLPVVFEAAK